MGSSRRSSRGKQESPSSTVSELPTSVIVEILFKLPIRSIIRCKCVCKPWYNLISGPYFSSKYLTSSPITALVGYEHSTDADPPDDGSFYFLEIGRNGDVVRTPFTPKVFDFATNGITEIMGSCNGLLCFVRALIFEEENLVNYPYSFSNMYNNETVFVVNPLVGECMLLPDVSKAEYILNVAYGFGLVASTNEYKVIRFVMKCSFPGQSEVSGEILTIGVDSEWRCFEDSSIPSYIFSCGISLDGVLHWIGEPGLIYAFDLKEEKGRCIALPQGLRDELANIDLAVWNGHLCLTDASTEFQVALWIMKCYGVADSWTRDVILKSQIPSDMLHNLPIPSSTLRNGDLLMYCRYGQILVSFDPKMKKCTKLGASDVEKTRSFLFEYAPSFVSLKSFSEDTIM